VRGRSNDTLGDDEYRRTCPPRGTLDDVRLANANAVRVRSPAEHEERYVFIVCDDTQPARGAANAQNASRIRDVERRRKAAEPSDKRWLHLTERFHARPVAIVILVRVLGEWQHVRQ
jgi:hypothetical protein